MKTKNDEYLRVKQAATILGVALNTVRKWGAEGKTPEYCHPTNTYRLYKRSDLVKLNASIEQSRTQPQAWRPSRRKT